MARGVFAFLFHIESNIEVWRLVINYHIPPGGSMDNKTFRHLLGFAMASMTY